MPTLHFALSAGEFVPDGTLGPVDGLPEFLERPRSDLMVPVSVTPGAQLGVDVQMGVSAGRHATAGVTCDAAVLSWGANDIGAYDPIPEPPQDLPPEERAEALAEAQANFDGQIDAFLSIPEIQGIPVLWIAPSPTGKAYPPARVEKWRQALERAEQRWPRLEVQDVPANFLGEDGVHYNPLGAKVLSENVANRLLGMVPQP